MLNPLTQYNEKIQYDPNTDYIVYKDITLEIWNRILNNLPYLYKTKGTIRGIKALVTCYGIPSSLLSIVEYGGPDLDPVNQIYNEYSIDNFSYAAQFNMSQSIQFDWTSSLYNRFPSSVQFRFLIPITGYDQTSMSLVEVPGSWSLSVIPTGTEYGGKIKFSILTGSNVYASLTSSDMRLYDGQFNFVTIQRENAIDTQIDQNYSLYVKKYDNLILESSKEILFVPSASNNTWASAGTFLLGGSGSQFAHSFDGSIDELRFWDSALLESTIDSHTKFPQSIIGNYITSSYTDLILRISFDNPVPFDTSSAVSIPSWNEVQPLGLNSGQYTGITVSSTGDSIVIANQNAKIMKSTNYASSFTDITPATFDGSTWNTLAMSDDGSVILAGDSNALIAALSIDGGSNWYTTRHPVASNSWNGATVSGDGNTLLLGTGFKIFISTDVGLNWTQVDAFAGNTIYEATWINYDGSIIILGTSIPYSPYTQKFLYKTVDGGANWTTISSTIPTLLSYYSVAASDNGNIILCAGYESAVGYHTYLSTDGGTNWTEVNQAGHTQWKMVKVSSDGSLLIMGSSDGGFFISTNSGSTWTEYTTPGAVFNYLVTGINTTGTKILTSDSSKLWFINIVTWHGIPLLSNEAPQNLYLLNGLNFYGWTNITTYPFGYHYYQYRSSIRPINIGSTRLTSNKIRFENTTTKDNVLQLGKTTEVGQYDYSKLDNAKLGLNFNPIELLNENIVRTLAIEDSGNWVGSPSSMYDSSYTDLDLLKKYYFSLYPNTGTIKEYINYIRFYDKSLFEHIKQMIPARTKLSVGIIYESNVLERPKYQYKKPYLSIDDNSTSINLAAEYKNQYMSSENISYDLILSGSSIKKDILSGVSDLTTQIPQTFTELNSLNFGVDTIYSILSLNMSTSFSSSLDSIVNPIVNFDSNYLICGEYRKSDSQKYNPVDGYPDGHYKNYLGYNTAEQRQKYIGCLQNSTTTLDLNSPVEVWSVDNTILRKNDNGITKLETL